MTKTWTAGYSERSRGKVTVPVRSAGVYVGSVVRPAPLSFRPVPYEEQPANKHWLTHYEAILRLDRMCSEAPTSKQRARLRAELRIAERKMEHWAKHANFDPRQAERDAWAAKLRR